MPAIQAWLIFYPFKRAELKAAFDWYVMLYKAHLGKGIVLLCCMATANIAMGHEELLQSTFLWCPFGWRSDMHYHFYLRRLCLLLAKASLRSSALQNYSCHLFGAPLSYNLFAMGFSHERSDLYWCSIKKGQN